MTTKERPGGCHGMVALPALLPGWFPFLNCTHAVFIPLHPSSSLQGLRITTKERPGRFGERVTKAFVDFVDPMAATAAMNLIMVGAGLPCRRLLCACQMHMLVAW